MQQLKRVKVSDFDEKLHIVFIYIKINVCLMSAFKSNLLERL